MIPKRVFWLVTGTAIGAGSTLWAERKVRRTLQQTAARLQPDALVVEVGRSARQVAGSAGDRVRDAVASGRGEMQRREEELWAELAASGAAVDLADIPSAAPSGPDHSPVGRRPSARARRSRAKLPSHLDK
jgi:hypothetical protein